MIIFKKKKSKFAGKCTFIKIPQNKKKKKKKKGTKEREKMAVILKISLFLIDF